jgi:3-oxoacyl-[acyl-carrier protein] reductase
MDLGIAGAGMLVVGGTSGMGLAAAHVLAADGARVAVVGRDRERASVAAKALADEHRAEVVAVPGDVSRPGEAERVVAEAVDALGGLAGVAVLTGLSGHEPATIGHDRWHEVLDDVLVGTVKSVEAALPHLEANGGGAIVTTSAYSIRDPHDVRLPYTTLKAAVATYTKGVAKAQGPKNIRANCVCPGVIETDGLHAMRGIVAEQRGIPYDEALERVMIDDWHLDIALRRPGRPQEVGEVIAFLLSARGAYVNGALINVDGGTNF